MKFVIAFLLLALSPLAYAGTCIDAETMHEIRCEHFTHLQSIPHSAKALAEAEKMYPHAQLEIADVQTPTVVTPELPKQEEVKINRVSNHKSKKSVYQQAIVMGDLD